MLSNKLMKNMNSWVSQGKNRKRFIIQLRENHHILINGNRYIDYSNNDYLGLNQHPQIKSALAEGIHKHGFGSASSNLISGYTKIQQQLEGKFAEWLNVDKTILFNCGYMANIGVISSLIDRNDTIFADKLCHASILDGIHLSRAKHIRYQHNSCSSLNQLAKYKPPQCIITESVFSMRGDIAPIRKILNCAKKFKAFTIIDDAHAIGILGSSGRGSHDLFDLSNNDNYCLIAPLGKAFNGIGAIVAANSLVIDAIIQYSKSYKYTTALPPALCYGLGKALDIISKDNKRQDRLKELIVFFNHQAIKRGFNIISNDMTPIRSIIIGNNELAAQIQLQLLQHGFYVSCIKPPSVPLHTARLRISLNIFHCKNDILDLMDCIEKIAETYHANHI